MKTPALALGALALLFAFLFAFLAPPAFAQYIYLDSNGDGVHTSADVLHGVGPTVVDIWLDIANNRDGSQAFCHSTPPTPLDMFMYEVDLVASGGTVNYTGYTNHVSALSLFGAPQPATATLFSTGPFYAPIGTRLPAGRYRLGTLTVSVLSGTPSLAFGTYTGDFFDPTMFGTQCELGVIGANSWVFGPGADWTDSDGLAFASGGMSNQPPILSEVSDVSVPAGENLVQGITASDADGQALSFTKAGGPGFLFVGTTDPNVASGEIRLAPFASDLGTSSGSVSVSDGTGTDQATFNVTVTSTANHPPQVVRIPQVKIRAGAVRRVILEAQDADGGQVQVTKTSGPSYVTLASPVHGAGAAAGWLAASPGLCDVGPATVSVSVTDGSSSSVQNIDFLVMPPTAQPDSSPLSLPDQLVLSVVIGDLNGDGKQDLISTHEGTPAVSVYLGHGDGTFNTPVLYQAETSASGPVVGDWNGDGHQDLAVANRGGSSVSVFLGRGDGTLLPPTSYPVGNGPTGIAVADMNRDRIDDLVVANQDAGSVSVLLGRGDGTFGPKHDAFAGSQAGSPVVGDFTLDGRPDVAVANWVPGSANPTITVLAGLGDGNFGNVFSTPVGPSGATMSLAYGDWDRDGLLDVVTPDAFNVLLRTLRGRGNGTFDPPVTIAAPPNMDVAYSCAVADLNADGNSDILLADAGLSRIAVFMGNGSGGFGSGIFLATPSLLPLAVTSGDLNNDGFPDIIAAGSTGVTIFLNRFGPANPALARAFVSGEGRNIPLGGGGDVSVQVEPMRASYTNDLLDFASFTLSSEGTGSVSQIHNVVTKRIVDADRDNNGISEVGVTFAKTDVASLFDHLHGRTTVVADLAGSLTDGRAFCTDVSLTIVGKAATTQAEATFAPNPLNPTSKLSFATEREGAARVTIFDLQGRLVRKLLDVGRLPAGPHELLFDGKTDRGATLSSGVYFYRVESVGGRQEGQIVILK